MNWRPAERGGRTLPDARFAAIQFYKDRKRINPAYFANLLMDLHSGCNSVPGFRHCTVVVYWTWRLTAWIVPNKVLWRQVTFHNWSRAFAMIARMKIEIVGTPPKPPFFLVCNHLSYVDIPALRLARQWHFCREKRDKGLVFCRADHRQHGQYFYRPRQPPRHPAGGRRDNRRSLNEGEGVIVFPEGTSTKGEDILPFNSSFFEFAAESDLPVSYASFTYATPPGGPTPSERVCWWDDTTFLQHLWRLFSLKRLYRHRHISATNRFPAQTAKNSPGHCAKR